MWKRKGLGILVALALGTAAVPMAATGSDTFDDIEGNVHASAIERIATLGITRGCNPPANDRYCPDDGVTRGQMAAFLVRTLDLDTPGLIDFDDTDGHVFETDVARLAEAGITRGCNPPANSLFCPDAEVTRGQMAAFLVRALGLTEVSSRQFSDTIGHVFAGDVDRLAAAGITRGCNPPTYSRFCPDQSVTRAEMATFLARAYDIAQTGTTTSTTPDSTSSTTSITTPTSTSTTIVTTTTAPTTTTTTTVPTPGAFMESGGVVVMEVESVPDVNPWADGNGFGAIGSFYFPDVAQGVTAPGSAVLTYHVWITEPGVYAATVRSRRDRTPEEFCDPDDPENPRDPELLPDEECVENGERNDIFVRMDGAPWDARAHKGTTHAAFGTWGWIDKWREDEGEPGSCPSPEPACTFRAFTWDLGPGLHTFEISRRAEQIKIDRIFLYRTDADPFELDGVRADRPNASAPESLRAP